MNILLKIIKRLLIIILIVVVFVVSYVYFHPTFGGEPNAKSLTRIKKSPNFDGKHFKNLIPTNATTVGLSQKKKIDHWGLFRNFIFPPKGKNPEKPLVTKKLNLKNLKNGEFVWLGHSTILFRTNNMNIITDPVFYNAAPVPLAFSPFEMTNRPKVEDLPMIDIVLISHDHYDHLDYKAIKELQSKVKHFYVPLGVKAHLLRWGIPSERISEFDWYEDKMGDKIKPVNSAVQGNQRLIPSVLQERGSGFRRDIGRVCCNQVKTAVFFGEPGLQ